MKFFGSAYTCFYNEGRLMYQSKLLHTAHSENISAFASERGLFSVVGNDFAYFCRNKSKAKRSGNCLWFHHYFYISDLLSEFIFYYKLVPTRSSHLGFYFATQERQSKQNALLCRKDTFPTGRRRRLGEDRRWVWYLLLSNCTQRVRVGISSAFPLPLWKIFCMHKSPEERILVRGFK